MADGLDRQPVDDHLDVVLLLLLQRRRLGQRIHHAVDPHPAVALRVQLVEQVDELALAGAHHRCEHLEAQALVHREHLVDDLLRGLPGDALTAHRAVRRAGPRVQQPQVVVDLGDGADGRARVAVGGLLVDRHRGRQALDEVDVGLVHLAEELPRVRRQRLDVAPLALGEDRVERQRRLARAGQAGENDQRIARQVEVDASQVVLPRTLDDQAVSHPVYPPEDIVGAHAMCPPTSPDKADTVSTMTVVDDNYTGHVEPQTAARRTLPGASIVKVSVGPMDNNAYLITCSQTGETLLIDAANDAEILLELIERYAPKLSLIVTSHQHQDHWLALAEVAKATGAPTAAHQLDADPLPVKPDRLLANGDTDRRSASCPSTSSTCRATPRDRSRWRSTAPPTRPRTCSPATACFPAGSARRGRTATSRSCSAT